MEIIKWRHKLNTANKFEIHASDIRSFKTCRIMWHFSSPLRMNLEPDYPPTYFFLGEGIHVALDHLYKDGLHPVEAFNLWAEWRLNYIKSLRRISEEREIEYVGQVALGRGMLEHYMQVLPPAADAFEVVSTETRFEAPILTPSGRSSPKLYAAGRFDGVIRDKRGGLWLLEHKSYKYVREDSIAFLDMDLQAGLYLLAAQLIHGEPFKGILYNILRKKLPAIPKQLKRGGLSVGANIDTTFEVYLNTIKKHNYAPADYSAVLERLRIKGNTFFRRPRIRRTQRELQRLMHFVYAVAHEMTRSNIRIYPTDHWLECNRCTWREPCLAYMGGNDPSPYLESNFRVRKARVRFNMESFLKHREALQAAADRQQEQPALKVKLI